MSKRKPKLFEDIVLKELKIPREKVLIEEENLQETYLPLTPFVAYSSLRKAVFNALAKNKFVDISKRIGKFPLQVKAKAATEVEKARATVGANSKDTVYRLTKEQMDVMSDIYDKYGKELVDEILEFRRKILAPYQLIKRTIKRSSRVSSKDITGMTKDEFTSSLESGRKKIQSRGSEYFSKSQDVQDRIGNINKQINNLKIVKSEFQKENPKLNYNIISKIYRDYDLGGEKYEGYPKEELSKIYDEIIKNYKSLLGMKELESLSSDEWERAKKIMDRSRDLWRGKTVDLTKQEKDNFYSRGDFNVALGKYFFSREIIKQLTNPGVVNIFKKTYISVIDKLIEKAEERKVELLKTLVSLKKNANFSEKEKAIWDKLPSSKDFSGNIEDYYQKVKEGQFLDKPIIIPRSEKLVQAEQRIENEIRKFERKLKTIITAEDYSKLKKYRLINNLITTKELRDPENMFKSKNDLMKDFGSEEGDKEDYLNSSEFLRRLREIATKEYDSMTELNNAKKEVASFIEKMKKQGDDEVIKDHEDLIRQISKRRTPEKKEIVGHSTDVESNIDIYDIEKMAKNMYEKDYTSVDNIKNDKERLERMISNYKEIGGEKAKENLESIQFLLDRLNRRMTTEKGKLS
jgi:hypothetical protein